MVDEATQKTLDAEEHHKSYVGIMRATGEVILPLVMAMAVFFVNLVLANGFLIALVGGVITYLLVFFVVRVFFSHH
jgi:hypothetical protein